MTSGSWNVTNQARGLIWAGTLNANSSWKIAEFTTAIATDSTTTYSSLSTEVSSTNTGYTTGGQAVTLSTSGTNPFLIFFGTSPEWTAGSANLAAVQAVLYDETSGYVLAWFDLDSGGATVTTTSGQTETISDTSANPIITIS